MPEGRSASGLIIPAGAGGTVGEPKFYCRVCGEEFSEFDKFKYVKHVVGCRKENEAELAEFVRVDHEVKMTRPSWADLEYEDAIRAHAVECKRRGIPFTMNLNRRPKE